MLDELDVVPFSVEFHRVDPYVKDASRIDLFGGDDFGRVRHAAHVHTIDGERRARLVLGASVRRRQTSIGQELVWLLIFIAIFAAVAAIVLRLAAAAHFNDRIAVTLAAILCGLIVIALRARFIGRDARSS